MKSIHSIFAGRLTYSEGLRAQGELVAACGPAKTYLLGLEHEPVVTLGKRAKPEGELLVSPSMLREKGIELHESDRGGQATVHNPGQLVVYPILPLRDWGLGVRDYVSLLEKVTAECLATWGIQAMASGDQPGLYTKQGKIAFFGVRVRKGVSSHGLAINVRNELGDFALIRSCGAQTAPLDKMENHFSDLNPREVFSRWTELFEAAIDI